MQPFGRPHDDRAVTPVVATVLLVAVVVLVGGVVGVYVFDIAAEAEQPPPQVAFTYDWDKDTRTLNITHASGDAFTDGNTGRLLVEIRDDDETGSNDFLVANRSWVDDDTAASPVQSFPVESGDSFVITGENDTSGDLNVEAAGSNVDNPTGEIHEPEVDDRVLVVWTADDGDQSAVVGEYVIPAGEDP
jgi:flagellin-like protein